MRFHYLVLLFFLGFFFSCASTEVVESPKTIFVPESEAPRNPSIIWTSRSLKQDYDYLGSIKVRSWTYQGAVERLIEASRKLRADAVIDINYYEVGFLKSMQAFAIKFKQ